MDTDFQMQTLVEATPGGAGFVSSPTRSRKWFNGLKSLPFLALHLGCLAVFFVPVTALGLVLCGVLYFVRMFGITAGYHRYFSHRSYKTSRWFQFLLAWLGCTAMQKGPLWWAATHRQHHRYSDTPLAGCHRARCARRRGARCGPVRFGKSFPRSR